MRKTLHKFVIGALGTILTLAWPALSNAQYPAGLRTPPRVIDPATGLPLPPQEILELDESTRHKKINLNLDGIPLPEVIEMLRKEYTNINFIVTPGVRDYGEALFLKLRSAGLFEILTGLYFATDRQIEYEIQSPTLLALVSAKDKPAEGTPTSPGAPPVAVKPPMSPKYQMLNLRDIFRLKDSSKVDEILKTISEITRTTLGELHGAEQVNQLTPKLNYHAGSGVLVMIGQQEGLELVNQVIRNLRVREDNRGGYGGAPEESGTKQPPGKETVPPKGPEALGPGKAEPSPR